MIDRVLVEAAERVFTDVATFDAVEAAEAEGFSMRIWEAVASMGLPWISIPEEAGGVGGTLDDAIWVLRIAGRFGAPIPLAETGMVGGWVVASAGIDLGNGALSVVPGRPDDTLTYVDGLLRGAAHRVPWAAQVSKIVALIDGQVVLIDPASAQINPAPNLAGEPRDTITFDGVAPLLAVPAPPGVTPDSLRIRGALSRAALIAGALEGIVALTVSYTAERKQFGKAVASFQSVQNLLVRCAEDAALVGLAVEAATHAVSAGQGQFEVACAKTLASDAARSATRAAHQAHGAMGMTREYPLHQLTRRLWSWRAEYGDADWKHQLGDALVAAGPDHLYDAIADGSGSGITL